jgi:8-oxo-dGTP pyrophosphatase MutT (NUDIX family)
MNADVNLPRNITAGLTRAAIRERLGRPRESRLRGDVAIAMELMRQGQLEPHDFGTFGQVPSTGIPYSEGAGAPGVKLKRKPAAVLVPLIEMPVGYSVLLTKRTSDLKQHAGQIAFPGGRMEETDADPVACALRETEEETGLPPAAVEILGTLDPYLTITGYEVTPVVGVITPPFTLKPDPIEVAETFEVPLSFLMDPANHHRVEREYKGLTRAYYAMPFGQKYIWGATAGMILNFYEVLSAP